MQQSFETDMMLSDDMNKISSPMMNQSDPRIKDMFKRKTGFFNAMKSRKGPVAENMKLLFCLWTHDYENTEEKPERLPVKISSANPLCAPDVNIFVTEMNVNIGMDDSLIIQVKLKLVIPSFQAEFDSQPGELVYESQFVPGADQGQYSQYLAQFLISHDIALKEELDENDINQSILISTANENEFTGLIEPGWSTLNSYMQAMYINYKLYYQGVQYKIEKNENRRQSIGNIYQSNNNNNNNNNNHSNNHQHHDSFSHLDRNPDIKLLSDVHSTLKDKNATYMQKIRKLQFLIMSIDPEDMMYEFCSLLKPLSEFKSLEDLKDIHEKLQQEASLSNSAFTQSTKRKRLESAKPVRVVSKQKLIKHEETSDDEEVSNSKSSTKKTVTVNERPEERTKRCHKISKHSPINRRTVGIDDEESI